jgi:hypothetical protein
MASKYDSPQSQLDDAYAGTAVSASAEYTNPTSKTALTVRVSRLLKGDSFHFPPSFRLRSQAVATIPGNLNNVPTSELDEITFSEIAPQLQGKMVGQNDNLLA